MLLLGTAVAVIAVLCLVTATFARAVLQDSRLSGVSPGLLAILTVTAILTAMVLCFVAFFRGRQAAKRRRTLPDGIPPHPAHSVVRTLIPKRDDRGRTVKAGATGTIVHVYPTKPSESPLYVVEVVRIDAKADPKDASVFDARHEELELSTRVEDS